MPVITSNELILPSAHAAQQTEDVGERVFNHLTAVHCLSMLQRIPRRVPSGKPRNTGMISNNEALSADPAEQPRIVAAAVKIRESAVLNHEYAPSVEEKENQLVATRRLQESPLIATPSLDQEWDQAFAAWTAYSDDKRWLRNPTGTRIPRNPVHYPSRTRWSC